MVKTHVTVFSTAGRTTGNDLMAPLASLAAPRHETQRVPKTLARGAWDEYQAAMASGDKFFR